MFEDEPKLAEFATAYQREKAQAALEKAKAVEAQQLAQGAQWVQIDEKTRILKPITQKP